MAITLRTHELYGVHVASPVGHGWSLPQFVYERDTLVHVTEGKPEPREVLHIRFRPGSIARIDAEAEADKRTRSDMVRVLVLEALEAREGQRKRRKV